MGVSAMNLMMNKKKKIFLLYNNEKYPKGRCLSNNRLLLK